MLLEEKGLRKAAVSLLDVSGTPGRSSSRQKGRAVFPRECSGSPCANGSLLEGGHLESRKTLYLYSKQECHWYSS